MSNPAVKPLQALGYHSASPPRPPNAQPDAYPLPHKTFKPSLSSPQPHRQSVQHRKYPGAPLRSLPLPKTRAAPSPDTPTPPSAHRSLAFKRRPWSTRFASCTTIGTDFLFVVIVQIKAIAPYTAPIAPLPLFLIIKEACASIPTADSG